MRYGPPARQAGFVFQDSNALNCFKGAGGPYLTPALIAGFNIDVPCASATNFINLLILI